MLQELKHKIADQYAAKARTAEIMAEQHDSFGPTRFGHEYRKSAAHWRQKAREARNA